MKFLNIIFLLKKIVALNVVCVLKKLFFLFPRRAFRFSYKIKEKVRALDKRLPFLARGYYPHGRHV
jgi:hypothetical protein